MKIPQKPSRTLDHYFQIFKTSSLFLRRVWLVRFLDPSPRAISEGILLIWTEESERSTKSSFHVLHQKNLPSLLDVFQSIWWVKSSWTCTVLLAKFELCQCLECRAQDSLDCLLEIAVGLFVLNLFLCCWISLSYFIFKWKCCSVIVSHMT